MTKKILIVDDELAKFPQDWFVRLQEWGEVIDSQAATKVSDARRLIAQYQEADIILLDGSFGDGDCNAVISAVPQANRQKVYGFSSEADAWWGDLWPKGVRHFPGKDMERLKACFAGECECHFGPSCEVEMRRRHGIPLTDYR